MEEILKFVGLITFGVVFIVLGGFIDHILGTLSFFRVLFAIWFGMFYQKNK